MKKSKSKSVEKKPLSWLESRAVYPFSPRWEELPKDFPVPSGLYWLPFASPVCVPAGVVRVSSSPDIGFRGKRLSVDPLTADSFNILDIRVGNMSTAVSGELGARGTLFPPIPRDLSPEERKDYEALLALDLPTASPAQRIEITVVNVSGKSQIFNAVLWGIVA